MTPITPAGREERMKVDQQRAARLVAKLAALIEQRDWPNVHDHCEAITELSNDILMDAYHVASSSPPPS